MKSVCFYKFDLAFVPSVVSVRSIESFFGIELGAELNVRTALAGALCWD